MNHNKHTKQNQNLVSEFIETSFGERTVSQQNFSYILALPKQALANCGIDRKAKVKITLVQSKTESYIKISPISGGDPIE